MATETTTTGRDSDKFMLRLPDGMRDELKWQAALNGRTLNAELVHRLQASLKEQESLPVAEDQFEPNAGMVWSNPNEKGPTGAVYLLLDGAGYPLSWEEMRTIWRALIQDEGLEMVKLEVHVLTPDMESSSARAEQATALAKRLRAGGKSVVLGKEKRRSDPAS